MARKRKQKREDKAKTQKRHAKTRMLQRYGIGLTEELYADLVNQIVTGRASFIERQSVRVSKFWVRCGTQMIPVVYDRHRKTIVTVLEQEWVQGACDTTPPQPSPFQQTPPH